MDNSKIEWTDATWNPLRGCSRVSEGCRNCYAERLAARFNGPGMAYEGLAVSKTTKYADGKQTTEARWTGQVRLVDAALDQPMRWRRARRVFVNSMSDLFHEQVEQHELDKIFAVMAAASWHTFQTLTKRAKRMQKYLAHPMTPKRVAARLAIMRGGSGDPPAAMPWPLPNVWLGVSVENQAAADERIPLLLDAPAAVRWVSAEPLLGPLNLKEYFQRVANVGYCGGCETCGGVEETLVPGVDWVVAGGESGPGARPMDASWAWSLKDQCRMNHVAFFFKQWGEHDQAGKKVGKQAAGRLLLGVTHDEYPEVIG